MSALHRRSKKDFGFKMNGWLWSYLVLATIIVALPFFELCSGENSDAYMDIFLEVVPLFYPTVFLILSIGSALPATTSVEMLVILCYFAIWGIVVLGMLLASKNIKYVKGIVYLLFVFDIAFNLFTVHHISDLANSIIRCSVDIVFCILLAVGTRKDSI